MDVTINQDPINVPAGISTWGDLLDWLETDYLQAGQCITRVLLNGSEALDYRDSLVCGRDLALVGDITVESGEFDKVVRESLDELTLELRRALDSTEEIVRLLENREEEEAYNRLAQLLDSIRIFFSVFSEDLGWSHVSDAEISREEYSAVLERALTQLIAAQESRMWVSICDVLEYEITPVLESWLKLAESTRARIN